MQYGTIAGINKPIARLAQGTLMISSKERDKSFALLDAVLDCGGTMFDTAHIYSGGDSERAFGEWVNARGVRDQVVILGKGAHPHGEQKRVTPTDITSDLHESLERMNTDYIDLYLLHRDDPDVPVSEIVDVLNEHHKAGRIHAFGGSNWSYQRIGEANNYAAANGLTPFAVSSPNFSLAEQVKPPWAGCISISGPQGRAAREWYADQGMALVVWSSLAGGFFSGRFRRDNLNSFTEYLDKLCIESYCYEDNFKRLDRVKQLAEQKGLSIPQVAMAYVMAQPLNIFALVGCQNRAEFEANAAAVDQKLSPGEVAWLDLQQETL